MTADERFDVAVVGAGISGLTVAFHLARAGQRVAVLEASDRVGGALTTQRSGDGAWLAELGPNTVLDNHPSVGALLAAAGLEGELLRAAPAAKCRFLWKAGRLHALPSSPASLVRSPLWSAGAKLRLLREPWIGRAPAGTEESIAGFVRRRLGQELLDFAVGPFVFGVYAGDPERLSIRWAVPKIAALEREHGSLVRGALAKRQGPAPGGGMFSLRDGLEVLPRRLAAVIAATGGEVRTGARCQGLERAGAGFALAAGGDRLGAARVVVAVPAAAAAELLAAASDGRSQALAAIPYAPVAVVALGLRRDQVAHPLDGFGFLVPRRQSLRILGCLFPSSLFPGRAPGGHVLLSAFAGGAIDPEAAALDDASLLALVRADLAHALGARGEPAFLEVRRWPRAIPQYELGHGRFVALGAELESALPGLYFGGNWLAGVSVPDCIRNATALAERLLAGG